MLSIKRTISLGRCAKYTTRSLNNFLEERPPKELKTKAFLIVLANDCFAISPVLSSAAVILGKEHFKPKRARLYD